MSNNKSRKQIVLFVVEGYSDIDALANGFISLYEDADPSVRVEFSVMQDSNYREGGDITSKYGINPNNIESMLINLYIIPFIKQYGLKSSDIKEIIQITDTDGTFISDEMYIDIGVEHKNCEICELESRRIIKRNEIKSKNIDKLISLDSLRIGKSCIPYSIYYFSSNLDHYLYDKQELDYRQKRKRAQMFSYMYEDDIEMFYDFMCKGKYAVNGENYRESWEYIKKGNNSIKRRTNIGVLIDRIMKNI